jgi:hypothetical protein
MPYGRCQVKAATPLLDAPRAAGAGGSVFIRAGPSMSSMQSSVQMQGLTTYGYPGSFFGWCFCQLAQEVRSVGLNCPGSVLQQLR